MQTYVSTECKSRKGVSFHRTSIGKDSSCGQRSTILSGAQIGSNVTVGAETIVQPHTIINDDETAFGSPLVLFKTSKTNQEVVIETQDHSHREFDWGDPIKSLEGKTHRGLPFLVYAMVMNLSQFLLPAIIISSYVGIFCAFYYGLGT